MKRHLTPALFFRLSLFGLLFLHSPAQSAGNRDYVVGPEDVLEIKVWSNDDLNRTVELSTEGAFTFPLIGKVRGGGLTVFELEKLLKDKLAAGYLIAPQVIVSVIKYNSQKVSILGEVRRPGSYFIKGKTHILELITEAEGLTEKAGRTVTIVRGQTPKAGAASIIIDLEEVKQGSADERLFLENGDSIDVAEAPWIYVSGEVMRPGRFKWEKRMTVDEALSLAGGPTKRAAVARTEIMRLIENGVERIKIPMDAPVMPGDIIKVPESYL